MRARRAATAAATATAKVEADPSREQKPGNRDHSIRRPPQTRPSPCLLDQPQEAGRWWRV